ncbi:ATP-binding protein [Hymenobacter sp. IS2118]|uniref:tetratricopeptide repeat-containing sensor histidine kinase n=2 Tax=Hymenobacter sp. IS2118 TaxID=1505605 RepID=UPI00068B2AAA|nr:ATP-binding protein [Hymenobacter sp. IS2118]
MHAYLPPLLGGLALWLLLLSPAVRAQPSPADKVQFQRRLRTIRFDHRYWDAPADSLLRVLASQRVDSQRLQTLEHLLDTGTRNANETRQYAALLTEALALANQLHYPERVPLRQLAYYNQFSKAASPDQRMLLDTLRAALTYYAALGPVPQPLLLNNISRSYITLRQPEARRAFFQRQLAYYQQHGPVQNVAMCYRALGAHYSARGDYNQGISYQLRAAELFRTYSNYWYYNEIGLIGGTYAEWGNGARALPYLQQAVRWPGTGPSNWAYLNRKIVGVYQRQGRYPEALRYTAIALRPRTPTDTVAAADQALGLVQQSAVLLALGRVAAVAPLLQRAQHLADSLRLPLYSAGGNYELNATWARYYTATGNYPRAEAAWLAAYRQAQQENRKSLRLAYLQGLARFYQQRGQPARATPYALAALSLTDTLATAQAATRVAQYELTQADRAQQARLIGLRQQQTRAAAQALRQRRVLLYVSAGVGLLLVLAGVLYAAFRRSERLTRLVTAQKQDLQTQHDELDVSLTKLRTTQAQLIQKEKMASLGELTAGIAHEIQNPLNFVNNFSEVSTELLEELEEEQARPARDAGLEAELLGDLRQNLTKITHHGRRAAAIVKGMLEHSRTSTGERAPTDLNRLAEEYLRLAYQGLRAKDKSFNAKLETDFAPGLPLVEAVGADLGRVLLNLFGNAFYAVQQRQQAGEAGYAPTVRLSTERVNGHVAIRVTDNGTGISPEVQAKIFQPFFTTKPTGEGTGLGLSLSHDIITKGHGGTLSVHSTPGDSTEFLIILPA